MPDFGRWNTGGGDPSLNEINRTDQFLDALASQQPVYATDRGEAELAQLLAGWRDDVRETPMGAIVTPQEAAAALDRVTSPGRRRRLSLAVIGSAAAAVLCLGGFGAVIAGSGPGDALYGLRTVLFGEQAQTRDDAVILAAQTEMEQVKQLIDQGDWQGAQAKLEAVTTTVATVSDVERRDELVTQWQELTVKVEAQNPAATVEPGAPLPTFPSISVDPNTFSVTAPSETSTSGTTSSQTTPSSSAETTSPSSPSPSESTSAATSPSSSSPTPSPTTTPSPATTTARSAPATTTPTSTTPSAAAVAPSSPQSAAPTSTSVVAQLSTAAPSASPTPQPTVTSLPTTTALPTTTVLPTTTMLPTTTTFAETEAFEQP